MTLVELLVTIAVLSTVTTALFSLIQSFYKNNTYLMEETAALANARRGLSDAITDIRESSYGDDGSYLIGSAGTSTLVVYSDIDRDSYVERVRYSLDSGVLYRAVTQAVGSPPAYEAVNEATSTVADNVRNTGSTPLFTYYDGTGTQLSTTSPAISAITSVRVEMLVDLNPDRAPNVFDLTEQATLRNVSKN
jgi:type II secretory pathway pseudopilin PulG